MTREMLPTIVSDRDNSSPNVVLRTGGNKSKFKSKYNAEFWIIRVLSFLNVRNTNVNIINPVQKVSMYDGKI